MMTKLACGLMLVGFALQSQAQGMVRVQAQPAFKTTAPVSALALTTEAPVSRQTQLDLAAKSSRRVHVRPSTWSRFPVKADPRLRSKTKPRSATIAALSIKSVETPETISADAFLNDPANTESVDTSAELSLGTKNQSTANRPRRLKSKIAKNEFTGLVSVGLDMRGERDQNQSTTPRSWPTLTIGAGLKPWMALLEYASFSENSGNNALNVQRKVETLLLWGQWSTDEAWVVQPYMAVGFGGYRTSAEMTLYTQKTASQGKWIEHGAGALGLRFSKLSPFLLAVEGRVHMNRELDPSPTLSGMLKMGFILE